MLIDPEYLARRRQREQTKAQQLMSSGDPVRRLAESLLSLSCMRKWARIKALDLRLEHNPLSLTGLADTLLGYRLLQIADPHFPEHRDHELEERIGAIAGDSRHDIAVLTGDYRDRSFGPFNGAIEAMRTLRPQLGTRALVVLGNHDSIDMIDPLIAAGYEVLLNSTITIQHGNAGFDILGVDDPSYYRMDDLNACMAQSPSPHRVLLAHSPDIHQAAQQAGIDAYLCGHTHGGQLCLPGGYALRHNSRAPGYMTRGAWNTGTLRGYTSRGAGTSIIDARSFCPPELTLHTLTRPVPA